MRFVRADQCKARNTSPVLVIQRLRSFQDTQIDSRAARTTAYSGDPSQVARVHTLGFFWTNLSRKAPSVRLRSGSPSYTTVVPASSVRLMAATDGCACAASRASSHQAARSAPQKAGSLP